MTFSGGGRFILLSLDRARLLIFQVIMLNWACQLYYYKDMWVILIFSVSFRIWKSVLFQMSNYSLKISLTKVIYICSNISEFECIFTVLSFYICYRLGIWHRIHYIIYAHRSNSKVLRSHFVHALKHFPACISNQHSNTISFADAPLTAIVCCIG